MQVRMTIVCENCVGRAIPAIGEHGFACWLEVNGDHYLIDSGQGLGIATNLQVLKLPVERLQAVVLSHGHYDHCGGLEQVLRRRGELKVFAHPDIFAERYSQSAHALRFIGIPQRRELLETLGAQFHFTPQFEQIAPHIYVTGTVTRRHAFEEGDSNLVQRSATGQLEADPFLDDMAVAIETPRGVVVILGCAHSGIINTLDHLGEKLGCSEFYAVVGGTHLGPVSGQQFDQTVKELERFNIQKLGVSHCTGQSRAAQLRMIFGSRFFFGSVGAVLEIH